MPDDQTPLVERLLKLREPIAVLLIFVFAFRMVMTVVDVLVKGQEISMGLVMRGAGMGFFLECILMLVVVGVCAVVDPPTPHARIIAIVAAVVTTVTMVVGLTFLIGSLTVPGDSAAGKFLEFSGGFLDVGLKGLAAWLLWQMPKRIARGSEPPRAGSALAWPDDHAPAVGGTEEQSTSTPATSPTAGARWGTAKEAASGGKAVWGSNTEDPERPPTQDLWKKGSS